MFESLGVKCPVESDRVYGHTSRENTESCSMLPGSQCSVFQGPKDRGLGSSPTLASGEGKGSTSPQTTQSMIPAHLAPTNPLVQLPATLHHPGA